jgi:hypothetical protein
MHIEWGLISGVGYATAESAVAARNCIGDERG